MSNVFSIQFENQVCGFNSDGKVLDSSLNEIGTWEVKSNQIFIKKYGGTISNGISLTWQFNKDNQLDIIQNNVKVGGINSAGLNAGVPNYRLKENAIVVDPDGDGNFTFSLNCRFGLQDNNTLLIVIDNTQSKLDGYVTDYKSSLSFNFVDKVFSFTQYRLVFSGEWKKANDSDDDGTMEFVPNGNVLIPGMKLIPDASIGFGKNNNLHLAYTDAGGNKSIAIAGNLKINNDMTVEFGIYAQKNTGLKSSTIKLNTTFAWDGDKGKLKFYLGKTVTPTSKVLEIAAQLTYQLQNGNLSFGMTYIKSTGGAGSQVTLATQVQYVLKNGNQIWVEYKQNGKHRELEVSAVFNSGKVSWGGKVKIVNDPQGRSIGGYLSVSW